jgi:DNA repair protein RecO (recombination protein O)
VTQVVTPALVLHVIPYGETSKILKLLTRELGLQSAIAKGARRARSRTGPRLDLFAVGIATLLVKPQRELSPLVAFELHDAHGALACDVRRFAAAAALVEIALRCAGPDPHPDAFDAAVAGLTAVEHAPAEHADAAALAACWGLVVALGYAPSVDRCVACGGPVGDPLDFSAALGGALCERHRGGEKVARLAPGDRAALTDLIAGRLPGTPLDAPHAAAHRRLLLGFIRHHLAEQRALPALAFWDEAAWTTT